MTVVLPGHSETHEPMAGPVTFILSAERLVTVRHHAPRPFETYPERADKVGPGCADTDRIFLSLIEEIIGRLADLLEGSGRELDGVAREVFRRRAMARSISVLRGLLQRIGREGEQISRVRLALLTIERALSFYGAGLAERAGSGHGLRPARQGPVRDIQALEVHADFLSSRVALASDATLGMINLAQAQTIKIFSVLAVVFLPPTVIASAYGMNFEYMPELAWPWGYPMAIALMVGSAVGTYWFFKWKKSPMTAMIEVRGLGKSFTLHNQGGAVIPVMAGGELSVSVRRMCRADRARRASGKSTLMRMIWGNYLARRRVDPRRRRLTWRRAEPRDDHRAAARDTRLCQPVPARRAARADGGGGGRTAAGPGRRREPRRGRGPRLCWRG